MIRTSRFGQLLLKKEVISKEILEKALIIQAEEGSDDQRRLEEILVTDFKIDHHAIFGLLAELYAFRTYDIDLEKIDDVQKKTY